MDPSHKDVVLCFSHDDMLRMTRQWLLVRADYDVVTVANETEFRKRICERPVALVVFCHTVKATECERSAAFAQEHCPGARFLVLFASQLSCNIQADYATLAIADGPAAFVQTVSRMLPKRAGD